MLVCQWTGISGRSRGCSKEIAFRSEVSLAEASELRREPCEAGGMRAVISGLENPLGDILMHAQAAMDMQANLARSILDDETDEETSWSIPGPKLRASSDRGASQLMFAVAGDDRKIREVSTQLRKQHVPSRLRERRATPQARAPRRLPSTTTST